ncbi:MAG: hypothetical protein R3F11_18995 [Verrucomicrobiales bacterium]
MRWDPANPANLAYDRRQRRGQCRADPHRGSGPGLYTLTLSAEGATTGGAQQFSLISRQLGV